MNIFRGTFRISVVVALLSGAYVMFDSYRQQSDSRMEQLKIESVLTCGAMIESARLESVKNEFGLFDIGKLGCSDKQFWASQKELSDAKNGNLDTYWTDSGPSLDYLRIATLSLLAFVLTNFAGLAFWVVQRIFKWVMSGFA
jgi:hypothetical protein